MAKTTGTRRTSRKRHPGADVADAVAAGDEAAAKTAPDARERKACPTAKSAAEFLPRNPDDLSALRKAAAGCQGCPLYCNATQTVFGEGPADALVMFVGEQPGDSEDKRGRPFVGPAGQLLDEAMAAAGVPREQAYVTNAVKHFKFEPRGARRIHAKPGTREVAACRPWLESEIKAVKPRMIVCLGATAAQALMGKQFRVTQQRGEVLGNPWAPWLMATVHPSALLRIPDDEQKERAYAEFVDDLRVVANQLKAERARR